MATIINAPVKAHGNVTYPKLRVVLDSLQFTLDSFISSGVAANRLMLTDASSNLTTSADFTYGTGTIFIGHSGQSGSLQLYYSSESRYLELTTASSSGKGFVMAAPVITLQTASVSPTFEIKSLDNLSSILGLYGSAGTGWSIENLHSSGGLLNFRYGGTSYLNLTTAGLLTLPATSNQLTLGATRTVTLTAPTPATASRTWTIPDISADGTFAALEGTQTFSGSKTFSSAVKITAASNLALLAQASLSGDDMRFFIDNTSNTSSSGSALVLRVAGTSAFDPYVSFIILSGSNWAIGADNSDSDSFKISQANSLGSNDFLTITTGGDLYTDTWQDYSGSSTIVGFSATTVKSIFYKKIGKLVFVTFSFTGTSNSTSFTFTLPYANNASVVTRGHCYTVDAGTVKTVGRFNLPISSSTVTLSTDQTGTGWTNDGVAGNKQAIGSFFYQTT